MRKLTLLGAMVAASAATTLLMAPAASATTGDNGTVKIHHTDTDQEVRANEPHPGCEFYLDAFGFDAVQDVDWTITEMPPTGTLGTEVESGELVLDAEGAGRSEDLTLASGHYKLTWNFDGENGAGKHKVFWVDCPDDGGAIEGQDEGASAGSEGSEGSESGSEGSSAEGQAGGEETTEGQTGGEETEGQAGGEETTGGQGGGDLAETGSSTPVVALSVGAAALVAAGGYLALRRRNATQG